MRVVVADDVLFTRAGLARLLAEAGCEVVGEAHDLDSALRETFVNRPDVVVLDIRMPPTHTDEGLVAAARIGAAAGGLVTREPLTILGIIGVIVIYGGISWGFIHELVAVIRAHRGVTHPSEGELRVMRSNAWTFGLITLMLLCVSIAVVIQRRA
jgi:CheY-like chemotaxis protein